MLNYNTAEQTASCTIIQLRTSVRVVLSLSFTDAVCSCSHGAQEFSCFANSIIRAVFFEVKCTGNRNMAEMQWLASNSLLAVQFDLIVFFLLSESSCLRENIFIFHPPVYSWVLKSRVPALATPVTKWRCAVLHKCKQLLRFFLVTLFTLFNFFLNFSQRF